MSLPATFKGGVTYLYLQLKVMFHFHMTRDTITALKTFSRRLEEKGLLWYPNKNMAHLQKEVQAVCVCLDEVGALPEETVIDIMSGLTHCSMPEFTQLFDCLLQNARAMTLNIDDKSEGDTLTQIKMILSKAVGAYHSLCTAGKWGMNHQN